MEEQEEFALEKYYLLDFERKLQSYSIICELNSPTYSKTEFLRKVRTFVLKEFLSLRKESKEESNHKIIYIKNCLLIDLIKNVLHAIIKFKWELSLYTSEINYQLQKILKEDFTEKTLLIEVESLIDESMIKNLTEIEADKQSYHIIDILIGLLNFNAKLLFIKGKNIKAIYQLYQAIKIKKLLLVSSIDLFHIIILNTNFVIVLGRLEKKSKAFSLIKKMLVVLEIWVNRIQFSEEIITIAVTKVKFFRNILDYLCE